MLVIGRQNYESVMQTMMHYLPKEQKKTLLQRILLLSPFRNNNHFFFGKYPINRFFSNFLALFNFNEPDIAYYTT